jgi:hypothetical protein
MPWAVSGWLLSSFPAKIGSQRTQELRVGVAANHKNTFAGYYAREISLFEALDPAVIAAYRGIMTGAKFVINPGKAR